MAATVKSQQELYDDYITELQAQAPDLTDDNEGSMNDVMGGVASTAVSELSRLTVDQFAKTFFDTAHGPEITLGDDDLEDLAVDHFGDKFARPQGSLASGTVTFSRPTTGAGDVTIPAGTVVKTETNANGVAQRFQTVSLVLLTGLSIPATVEAFEVGTAGNVATGTVTVIESTLTDTSVVVNNAAGFGGGENVEDDSTYRETIRNLIETLRGATIAAIEATALTVPGVATATVLEEMKVVKEWDIGDNLPIGEIFRVAYATLYIADVGGSASTLLIDAVLAAIESERACGVRIAVAGAVAIAISWTGAITLNPSGPNYATLVTDPQMIIDTMLDYIADLPIGSDFESLVANAAILTIWGPAGTGDLIAGGFVSLTPSGNISVAANQKPVPGTVTI